MAVASRSLGGGHAGSGSSGHTATGDRQDAAVFSPPPDSDDLAYPCNTVDDAYKGSCWTYQYLSIHANSGQSWDLTLEGCHTPQHPRLVGECLFGVGKQLASENYFDWAAVYDVCGMLPVEEGKACISGAAEHLVAFEWASEKAAAFCEGSPTPLAESCRFKLGTRLGFLYTEPDARHRCASTEGHLREACRRGVSRTRELRGVGD